MFCERGECLSKDSTMCHYAGLPGGPARWLKGHFLSKIKIYLSIYLSIYLLLSGIAILPTCILLQLREHWLSIHPEKGWLLRCLGLILQPLLAV